MGVMAMSPPVAGILSLSAATAALPTAIANANNHTRIVVIHLSRGLSSTLIIQPIGLPRKMTRGWPSRPGVRVLAAVEAHPAGRMIVDVAAVAQAVNRRDVMFVAVPSLP